MQQFKVYRIVTTFPVVIQLVGVSLDFVGEAENWVNPETFGEDLEFSADIKFKTQRHRSGWTYTENTAHRSICGSHTAIGAQ